MEPITIRTIARNSRHAQEVLAHVSNCKCYAEYNYFQGEDCDSSMPGYILDRFPRAKLRDRGKGVYHVDVHSNLWYVFQA